MMVMVDAFLDLCGATLYMLIAGVICVSLMSFGEWVWNKIRKHR